MQSEGLSKEDARLLEEVLQRRAPELLPLIERWCSCGLTEEQVGKLTDAVDDEMCAVGFESDGEPNDLGRRLEAIGDCLVANALGKDESGMPRVG